MTDPSYYDLTFPVRGLDQQAGVGGQSEGTTATAINVRACDPRTRRLRGGSRSGLVKFIDAIPGGTVSVIQHLAVTAYTSNDGLPEDTELVDVWQNPPKGPRTPGEERPPPSPPSPSPPTQYPDDWVVDPHDPDRYLPPGGTGTNLDPDDTTNPALDPPGGGGPGGWVYKHSDFVEGAEDLPVGSTVIPIQIVLPAAATDNQLLCLGLVAYSLGSLNDGLGGSLQAEAPITAVSVTDSLGNTWTEANRQDVLDSRFGVKQRAAIGLYYTRTNAGSVTVTVNVTVNNTGDLTSTDGLEWHLVLAEYTGLENASPFEGSAESATSVTPNPVAPVTVTAGACPVGGSTRLAVGLFVLDSVESGLVFEENCSVAGEFTIREEKRVNYNPATNSGLFWIVWIDDTSTGSSSEPTVTGPPFWTIGTVNSAVLNKLAVNGAFRYGV